MQLDIVSIGLAFIEGFALIISPCILPIFPIILSGSLTGNKARPLGIISGFIITFCAGSHSTNNLCKYHDSISISNWRWFTYAVNNIHWQEHHR